MATRLFTDEQESQIRRDYEDGKSLWDIAGRLHTSATTIRNVLRRAGGKARPLRRLAPETEFQIRGEYEAGATTVALEAKYQISAAAIGTIVRRSGGNTRVSRSKTKMRREQTRVSADDKSRIIARYRAGESMAAIAGEEGGWHQQTCYNVLRAAGESSRGGRKWDLDHDYFESLDTPAKLRWFGFLAADGCVILTQGYRVSVILAARDRSHLEAFRLAIGYTCPLGELTHDTRGTICYRVYTFIDSKKMVSDLQRHGMTPRKSLTYDPPDLPDECLRHVFAGMMDGDGSFSRWNGYWQAGLSCSLPTAQKFAAYLFRSAGRRLNPSADKRTAGLFSVKGSGISTPQAMARLFYTDTDGGTPLARKQILAEQILSVRFKQPHPA